MQTNQLRICNMEPRKINADREHTFVNKSGLCVQPYNHVFPRLTHRAREASTDRNLCFKRNTPQEVKYKQTGVAYILPTVLIKDV